MKKLQKLYRKVTLALTMGAMAAMTFASTAFAGGISPDESTDMGQFTSIMNKVIGILLTVMRYGGVVMLIYGVYEIFMSFSQNQPEAKTKGIWFVAAGVAMISLKSILSAIGVFG